MKPKKEAPKRGRVRKDDVHGVPVLVFGMGEAGGATTTFGRKLVTNSFTVDQYPGWTHVSSFERERDDGIQHETKRRRIRTRTLIYSLCVPAPNSMYLFSPSTRTRGGALGSSGPGPSSSFSSTSSSFSSADPPALLGDFLLNASPVSFPRPRLRMIAQSSCICERGTTSSRAPPSMSTGSVGGSFGACRGSRVGFFNLHHGRKGEFRTLP